jgi:serine/threonine-protein kinase
MRFVRIATRHPAEPVRTGNVIVIAARFAHGIILPRSQLGVRFAPGPLTGGRTLYHLPMPLVTGATAAEFNIVRQLGYEEFGELYVAEHPRLPRQQVLHLIPAETSIDLDYRVRFNQESDLAAPLWHPNIAGLTDRGEFEDRLWISSEYVDGIDSAELLGEGHLDGMPPRMVIEIVSAIADALDYAHDAGVLHRFVNPGRILVSKSPADRRRIVLTGFGVARPEGAHNTLTRAGMFIGTAGYTAPEQLMGDELDGRVDQYSLAASAFHLLTGAPPFAHFNPSVVVNRQLNDRAPRPSEIRPDLTDFDAIFARALSKDPVDRFRRCRDFAKALESTGGTRSHIRATSEVRAASIFREATTNGETNGDAAAAATVVTPEIEDPAPTEVVPTAAAVAAPESNRHTIAATPDVVSHNGVPEDTAVNTPETSDEYDEYEDYDDEDDYDESAEARRRRLRHSAAIAGVIAVVLIAWFAGIKALRSASQSNETPANVETSSAEPTTTTPAFIAPPPIVVAPPPPPVAPPPPVVTKPTPTTTAPSTTKAAPSTTAKAQTTVPETTVQKPQPATTTRPTGLDTRPAIGMPCGAEGSAAISNSGGPVTCVSTPGGSAWEAPGTPPSGG